MKPKLNGEEMNIPEYLIERETGLRIVQMCFVPKIKTNDHPTASIEKSNANKTS